MVVLIVSLLSVLFIYLDYKRNKNIGRSILYAAILIVAIFFLSWIMRFFRYGLIFALIFIPIYLTMIRKKK
jgi:apolipoprotein N-acyltransferase